MTTKLIYHTNKIQTGGISPFDECIHQIITGQDVSIVCPYLGIEYLNTLLSVCKSWRLITDVEEWIRSHREKERQKLVHFILQEKPFIHHYKNLHAKVIMTKTQAMLGSANFTKKGILERIEMGVFLEDEHHIKELRTWFAALWQTSDIVQKDEVTRFVQDIPESMTYAECSSQATITSNAPQVHARFMASSSLIQHTGLSKQGERFFSEAEILHRVFSKNKIEQIGNATKVFQLVKAAFPEELRQDIAIRTDVKQCQISFILQNYLLFRLPCNGKEHAKVERRIAVYLIYPQEDIDNLQGIVEDSYLADIKISQGRFASFPCFNAVIRYSDLLQFQTQHWKSFQKACYMAKNAKKSRRWNTNIQIDWQ